VESYLRQQIHGGAASGEAATQSPRAPPPPKLSGDPRATSQQTLSPATPPSEGEQAQSPGLLWRRGGKHGHQGLFRPRRSKRVFQRRLRLRASKHSLRSSSGGGKVSTVFRLGRSKQVFQRRLRLRVRKHLLRGLLRRRGTVQNQGHMLRGLFLLSGNKYIHQRLHRRRTDQHKLQDFTYFLDFKGLFQPQREVQTYCLTSTQGFFAVNIELLHIKTRSYVICSLQNIYAKCIIV